MINSKKKGNHWENVWANWLSDNGIKAFKDGASGGGTREKSDVGNNIDYSFQIKAVKKLNLQEAWRQTTRDAAQVHDIPAVVVHFDGMAENDFLIVMSNHDWIELVKKDIPEMALAENPKLKWPLKKLQENIKSVLKLLPE